MGPGARRFAEFLEEAGQSYWQVLPLNPPSPGEGNSPYSSSSAFAGNVLLISPEVLVRDGWLPPEVLKQAPEFSKDRVDYGRAIQFKDYYLNRAYLNFTSSGERDGYEKFCAANSYWLDDYALFTALKEFFAGQSWANWPSDIRDRDPGALSNYGKTLAGPIEKQKFLQFVFFRQWADLKEHCNERNIKIMGDIPIYMSYQSADVWAHPDIFKLDKNKKPTAMAGVPPDYFSRTGQLWGNPVYNWSRLQETRFEWWVKRIEQNLKLFDLLRIDHFRGLVAYWEVPAGEKTAINGKWVPAPGEAFLDTLTREYPSLPIIAEDLGTITDDVREFIEKYGIPGMKVLLFAFGDGFSENLYAPHNHVKNCVVYTGTHDNNTARGWYEQEASEAERRSIVRYLGREIPSDKFAVELVRLAMSSVADIVILPMQDILGLGAEARMNTPSTVEGNWEWRLNPAYLSSDLARWLRDLTEICGRLPKSIFRD